MVIIRRVNGIYHLPPLSYPFTLNGRDYEAGATGVFYDEPTTLTRQRSESVVVRYKKEDYGSIISPEEYEQCSTELYEKYEESNDLDDEYAYKKFLETWVPVYQTEVSVVDIPFVVHDITGDMSNPYIVPLRLLGKSIENTVTADDRVLYNYTPNPAKLAREIGQKYGFEQVADDVDTTGQRWCVPGHSVGTLRFMKINGKYISNDGWSFHGITIGTLKECQDRYNEHVDILDGVFKKVSLELAGQGKGVDAKIVSQTLDHIMSMVRKLDVKVKSSMQKRFVIDELTKLQNKVLEPTE